MEVGRHRQFQIHHCLGRGGYGEVYRATMLSPGGIKTDVAVKLLRHDVDAEGEAVRRLKDEGRMLGVLRHPAILRVYDLALLDGRVGLVTEYVEGQDLTGLIGRVPIRAMLEIVSMVAEALDVAWNHRGPTGDPLRLVHRDIKPSNVRLGRHGEVKVLDFGIARSTSEEVDREAKTGTGSTVGSLAYMAPERFTRAPSAPAADVFGLGCSFYEGLTGRRVFEDAIPVEMFRLASDPGLFAAHVESALEELPPSTDPEVVDLIRRTLSHAPGQRPPASECRAICDSLVERMPGEPLRRWARERAWPDELAIAGQLDGRVLTEGTLSTHDAIELRDLDDRSSDTFRYDLPEPKAPLGHSILKGLIGLLIVVVLALVVATALGWLRSSSTVAPPPPRPVVIEPPPAPVVPVPIAAPVVVPVAAPIVVAPTPRPVPRPTPRPVVVEPSPVPVPVPVEVVPAPVVPVQFGTVTVVPPGAKLQLRAGDQVFGAGRVPVGRYELWADLGYGMINKGIVVDVIEGFSRNVECNTITHDCSVGR